MVAILTALTNLWSVIRSKAAWYCTRFFSFISTPPHLLLSPWYIYSPLSRTTSTIRLLHLHPGRGRLSVSLKAIPFDDSNKVQYEAVSYAWGDDTLRESLYCDGLRLDINASLYAALSHLRSNDPNATPRVLWADAICINQRDNDERAYQVALMGKIYTRPTGVLIWLGADTKGLSTVATSIDQVRAMLPPETYDADELIRNSQDYHFAMSNLRRNGQKDRHFHHHNWTDINELLLRPWFDRKWTIQEVIMAPDTVPRTLIAGDVELPWMSLASLGFVMASYGLTVSASAFSCRNLVYGYPGTISTFYKQGLRPLRMISNAQIVKVISFYRDRATLLDCVIATGMFASKDVRDQIFALLSLGSHDPSFQADYDKDPEVVLTDFAKSTLVYEQNLKYLGIAPHRGCSMPGLPLPARLDLPSWVCDLSIPTFVDPLASYSIRDPVFHAGTSEFVRSDPESTIPSTPPYKVKTSGNGKILHLRGRIVDTVTDFATCPNLIALPTAEDILPWVGFTNQLRMRSRNWFWECQRLAFPPPHLTTVEEQDHVPQTRDPASSSTTEPPAQTGHPLTPSQAAQQAHYRSQPHALKQLFARTLLCDMIGMRDPIPIATIDAFIEYIDFMTDFFTHPKDYSFVQNDPERRDRMVTHGGLIETALNGLTMARKFCVTQEGRWGQVRVEAQKGDLICVVTGAEVPFVLRPVASRGGEDITKGVEEDSDQDIGGKQQEKRYTLIGDCYLTGMMHGEALRDSRFEEVEIELE